MTASLDYEHTYQQAYKAYVDSKYEEAAGLIDQAVSLQPNDPNTHLLRGHVYYVLEKYDIARTEYQKVLQLTNDQEIIGFAKNGLDNVNQCLQVRGDGSTPVEEEGNDISLSGFTDLIVASSENGLENVDDRSLDLTFGESKSVANNSDQPSPSFTNPFDMPTDTTVFGEGLSVSSDILGDDPFAFGQTSTVNTSENKNQDSKEFDLPGFWEQEITSANLSQADSNNSFDIGDTKKINSDRTNYQNIISNPFGQSDLPPTDSIGAPASSPTSFAEETTFGSIGTDSIFKTIEDETLMVGETALKDSLNFANSSGLGDREKSQEPLPSAKSSTFADLPLSQDNSDFVAANVFEGDDSFDFEAFEAAFGDDTFTSEDASNILSSELPKNKSLEFLDDFDEFDNLSNIPGFEVNGNTSFGDVSATRSSSFQSTATKERNIPNSKPKVETPKPPENSDRDSELFSITASSQESIPVFTQSDVSKLEPVLSVEQGIFAPLENAPLKNKQWFVAGTAGVVSALAVAVVSFAATNFAQPDQREGVRNTGWAMALAAGIASVATCGVMGKITTRQIRLTTQDLQAQFDAVRQGNLNVQATVYSEDEFGQLAAGFNEMARVIFTTTNEATRKAQEQEEAKENLQRQVIRLLDDVEGAARGDLTVQAEVTADVLGAVADAFNLTIQNLRDIVQQVKVAAREVTKGATNSETFARALSSDALRQAEELAVTLSSVQVMTDSIQRVAEAAREAETVARDASCIALKGGEAVENTVAGILEIRETVAETTRKVKRLAESSQEISKIVALISQIASRTNLLALNASIEAARAGEAGRGFAIVADEVRQLADKSAKSLKEIEQIVMQIQSETGSVMTAMEEGTQQVIKGTKLAEEAKRSLENIIQVANRIDILVRSITTDTVEQTETSRAVAQVMQSVELTAQETSQEAQRVSGALQHLVGVSRDLIASVERFRVETTESR